MSRAPGARCSAVDDVGAGWRRGGSERGTHLALLEGRWGASLGCSVSASMVCVKRLLERGSASVPA